MVIGIDASRATTGQRTGTEAYAYHLIRALIPLAADRGHQLRLYFNQPPRDDLFEDWGNSERIVMRQSRLWTHWALGRLIANGDIDEEFILDHLEGFEAYRRSVCALSLAEAAKICGVAESDIRLAATRKKEVIIVGGGLAGLAVHSTPGIDWSLLVAMAASGDQSI